MRRFLIFCALLLSGCGEPPRTIYAAPHVPADLRRPCLTPPIAARTEGELMARALRIAADRDCANAKIAAVDQILTGAEGGQL